MVRRVAYLNPYLGLAEDQAFHSLRSACAKAGVELVAITPAQLTEGDDFEFVISTTSVVRKTTSHPHYLSAHAPRSLYVDNEQMFSSTCSYDGYLCISDSLVRFFSHLAEGLRLPVTAPGFYYNSPQRLDVVANIEGTANSQRLGLCYFGTNWDSRAELLFHTLSHKPYMRIYGPETAWGDLPGPAYQGTVPFDGTSVQAEYEKYGVGLVILSQEHLLDDIVSNRVFEIASVGAAAICPDTPWMRDNFGDSVFYYAPFVPVTEIVERIDAIMEEIRSNPAAAADRARRAKAIFEELFSAEAVFRNVLDYHARWTDTRDRSALALQDTTIDVIIRTGGRSTDYIRRAIGSIDAQSAGRFRLIIVQYRPVDLTNITAGPFRRICAIEVLDCPDGNRSQTLVAGLARVSNPYFAVLDDDDYLLTGHFQGLLSAIKDRPEPYVFAYSDILQKDESEREGPLEPDVWGNGVTLLKEGPAAGDIHQLLQRFSPHCFLASSRCLETFECGHWQSITAEDVLLICNLLKVATPVHAPGATCVYSVGRADASDFWNDPHRLEDELALVIAISPYFTSIERKFAAEPAASRALVYPVLRRLLEGRRERIQKNVGAAAVLGDWAPLAAIDGNGSREGDLIFLDVPLRLDRASGNGTWLNTGGEGQLLVVQPQVPWELTLIVDVSDYALSGCSLAAAVVFEGTDEPVAFGLTDPRGDLFRKVLIPPNSSTVRATISSLDGAPVGAAALQAGAKPSPNPLRVHQLQVGYHKSDLSAYFGTATEDAEHLRRLLAEALESQVIGRPAEPVGAGQPVDFRTELCSYSAEVSDGAMRDGAPRHIHTGASAWDYFTKIYVPATLMAASRWLKLEFGPIGDSFYVAVVDEGFAHPLSDRLLIRAGKVAAEVWVDVQTVSGDGYLVFQCTDAPVNGAITLRAIHAI